MATFLYRLGRFSYRRRGIVLIIWLAVLGLAGIGAATLAGNTSGGFSMPGTESQEARDHLAEVDPVANPGGAMARVVFVAPDGQTLATEQNAALVGAVVLQLNDLDKVAYATDPFSTGAVSGGGNYAYSQVAYEVEGLELGDADHDALEAALTPAREAGLTVEVGGDALQAIPETGVAEVLGVGIAAIVLIITFGSLVAAGLPLLTALIGIGVGVAGITTASGFIDLNSNTTILALMLGLAVCIDYALFIVSRYRHELKVREDGEEAAGYAVGTAGSAVVFAGLTVVIALAGLSIIRIPLLVAMGLAAAATVAISVLVALTLLPALLGFAGRRILPRRERKNTERPERTPMGEKWARFVVRFRVPVLILSLLGLGVLAVPAADLRLALPDDGMATADTTQRKAYDLITEGFGPGVNGPLVVVVDGADSTDPMAAATEIGARIGGLGEGVIVTPPRPAPDGTTVLLTVIPSSAPTDEATTDLVHAIRDARDGIRDDTGAVISVTGLTAMNIDISQKMYDALLPYLAIVVGLAFLLLMLVFRSILVPLKAALGFLLSVAATFGAVVAVYQWGWLDTVFNVDEPGPIMSLLPILLVGILFGLAMDYQVFLVTRMREDYVHGAGARDAVVTGFRHGARVVVAAAIIMISVFGGFIFADESLIRSIGFALAFGVLVDAFVVRMTIVPAVMALLGRSAWWLPRWLARILPNVDVEGEKLSRTLAAPERETVGAGAR
ncbi:MMPL family transporter [Phytomonospora endophytica]|uniref:RND superfamily putative drug exporter n=1 Tax=Phytomonospora endophytica TaxID=714109 RepID=A0A841FIF2_9ACTN|nr:MMPL family transporter [Phytomonospora endophytica]MBB6035644.1 RND superfamily putative drug exporter [Phytomonospora endophytica]GIG69993.1 membrane protein [Phytomonospora endophytica]